MKPHPRQLGVVLDMHVDGQDVGNGFFRSALGVVTPLKGREGVENVQDSGRDQGRSMVKGCLSLLRGVLGQLGGKWVFPSKFWVLAVLIILPWLIGSRE